MTQPTEITDLNALYDQLDAEVEPSKERRVHPRTSAKGHVPASMELPGNTPIAVAIRDLSRSGMGIFAPHAIMLGAQVLVSFHLGGRPVRATCKIVNCRQTDGGRFIIGLVFTGVERLAPGSVPVRRPAMPQGKLVSTTVAAQGADLSRVGDVVERLNHVLKAE